MAVPSPPSRSSSGAGGARPWTPRASSRSSAPGSTAPPTTRRWPPGAWSPACGRCPTTTSRRSRGRCRLGRPPGARLPRADRRHPLHRRGGGQHDPVVAAPLAAALGVRVAKMSGRGLAHTGGTVDKLRGDPGLPGRAAARPLRAPGEGGRHRGRSRRPRASPRATGASARPARRHRHRARGRAHRRVDHEQEDRRGRGRDRARREGRGGGFFADEAQAAAAAELMASLAEPWGRHVRWTVTSMAQPLGRCVGNALEVREAGEVLRGDGAPDIREPPSGWRPSWPRPRASPPRGRGRRSRRRPSGPGPPSPPPSAGSRPRRAIRTSGPTRGPCRWRPDARASVLAEGGGWVQGVDARGVGEAARWLGAGRLHADQSIDPVAGVELLAKAGAPGGGRGAAGGGARARRGGGAARARAGRRVHPARPRPPRRRRWCWRRGGAVPELPEVETIRRQLAERMPGPHDRPGGGRRPAAGEPRRPRGVRGPRGGAPRSSRSAGAASTCWWSSTRATRWRCTCA